MCVCVCVVNRTLVYDNNFRYVLKDELTCCYPLNTQERQDLKFKLFIDCLKDYTYSFFYVSGKMCV